MLCLTRYCWLALIAIRTVLRVPTAVSDMASWGEVPQLQTPQQVCFIKNGLMRWEERASHLAILWFLRGRFLSSGGKKISFGPGLSGITYGFVSIEVILLKDLLKDTQTGSSRSNVFVIASLRQGFRRNDVMTTPSVHFLHKNDPS